MEARERFVELYGHEPKYRFSAPGRTELSGNHTDHQHGVVLAAALRFRVIRRKKSRQISNKILCKKEKGK